LAWDPLDLFHMNSESRVQLASGVGMPVVGLGTWQLTNDTAGAVEEALELGYRLIDTSGDYGTQPGIGEALRRTSVPRNEIFLVTKVEETDDAYDATRRNLDELDQAYVDLMLIHRPPRDGAGVELWEGLIRAREEGLARDVGVSNYTQAQIGELIRATGRAPVVNQIEWSPFGWSMDLLAWCRRHRIVPQGYSPLTRGQRLDDPVLRAVAERHGKTPAQVLLRWNRQLGVVPLPKANRREHQAENLEIFDFILSDQDMAELGELNRMASSLGELPYQ
jgi:2,5-diketo-D-gluconate reductase A